MPRAKNIEIEGFVEQRRIVAKVHVSREDQMGDTTEERVLAQQETDISWPNVPTVIDRMYKNRVS